MLFDRHVILKYKYGTRHFGIEDIMRVWSGKIKVIEKYIQNQPERSSANDPIAPKKHVESFMSNKNK